MAEADFEPVTGALAELDLLTLRRAGPVLHVELNRPTKRNALSDALVRQIHAVFADPPDGTRAAVLSGAGSHFCAGLDLSEVQQLDIHGAIAHSRMWHTAFDAIAFGRVPVVAVLHGAVVGGGLEIAAACQLRVAEDSAYFGLPEGQRGLFLGGGGSVRLPRLIGVARVADMMLTGRVLDADHAERSGLVQYRVADGAGLAKGIELARRIAGNAPMTTFAVMHALPRIAEQSPTEGLFTESLIAAAASASPEAQRRLQDFLQGRAGKVVKS